MTTTSSSPPPHAPPATAAAPTTGAPRRGRWIDHWDPEDPTFWETRGRTVARRNLIWSIFAEHLGFSVWLLWSIVVVQMGATASGAPGPAGFALTLDQQLWLVAVPSGVGAFLRLPYTFAVPIFGGRNWTVISALLLADPLRAAGVGGQRPDDVVRHAPARRGHRRPRRRQLRVVDDEHLLLLPRA